MRLCGLIARLFCGGACCAQDKLNGDIYSEDALGLVSGRAYCEAFLSERGGEEWRCSVSRFIVEGGRGYGFYVCLVGVYW